MTEKEKKIFKLSALVTFIILQIIFAIRIINFINEGNKWDLYENVRKGTKFSSEFKLMRKLEGNSYIMFTDGSRYILEDLPNNVTHHNLSRVIMISDSISKREGSDTIYFFTKYHRMDSYYFILRGD